MEYQNQVNKVIRRKFVKILNDGLKSNINQLSSEKKTKYPETIDLLIQSYKTLNNSEQMLKNNNFTDSNVLLRTALEYLMMGINIQFNENTYSEFKVLGLSDKERDNTKPSRLISEFRTHLNSISEDFFKDLNRKDKLKLFNELYSKLCNYTHGTLIVTSLSKIKKKSTNEVFKLLGYINLYFLKLLLYLCLKYFTNDKNHYIELQNIYFSYFFSILKLGELIKNSQEEIKELNKCLYLDDNNDYLSKIKEENNKNKNSLQELSDYINANKNEFIDSIKEFLS